MIRADHLQPIHSLRDFRLHRVLALIRMAILPPRDTAFSCVIFTARGASVFYLLWRDGPVRFRSITGTARTPNLCLEREQAARKRLGLPYAR